MTGFRDSVHVFCIAEIIGPYIRAGCISEQEYKMSMYPVLTERKVVELCPPPPHPEVCRSASPSTDSHCRPAPKHHTHIYILIHTQQNGPNSQTNINIHINSFMQMHTKNSNSQTCSITLGTQILIDHNYLLHNNMHVKTVLDLTKTKSRVLIYYQLHYNKILRI